MEKTTYEKADKVKPKTEEFYLRGRNKAVEITYDTVVNHISLARSCTSFYLAGKVVASLHWPDVQGWKVLPQSTLT